MGVQLKLSSIINDPSIKVDQNEDLNLENNIRWLALKAMNRHDGNKVKACWALGISVRTFYNYIEFNSIVFDTKEKKYVSLRDIMYNADQKDRYVGVNRKKNNNRF